MRASRCLLVDDSRILTAKSQTQIANKSRPQLQCTVHNRAPAGNQTASMPVSMWALAKSALPHHRDVKSVEFCMRRLLAFRSISVTPTLRNSFSKFANFLIVTESSCLIRFNSGRVDELSGSPIVATMDDRLFISANGGLSHR